MKPLVGTSGYSYKEWKGNFYPEKLPAAAMLRFYAERFATVEINNSFYRMPAELMLAKWRDETPAAFKFTLKAPRRITHEKRLRGTGSDVAEFLRRADTLGDKLGALLFQLPPFMRADVALLEEFLAALPPGKQVAFEFRHPSWRDDKIYETLRAHSAPLCVADTDEDRSPLVATASWGYLRLRRSSYDDADLRAWIERIAAQRWAQAYVYFKHEDEALGPRFAERFEALWGASR